MRKPSRYLCSIGIGVAIAILIGFAADVRADSYDLSLVKMKDVSQMVYDPSKPDFLFQRTSGQYLRYDPNNNNNVSEVLKKDRETYECKFPFKGVFELGGEKYAFAMDSDDLYKNGYNKLYYDKNRNGDLSDETVIEAKPLQQGVRFGEGSSQREFPTQEISMEIDGAKYDYAFAFGAYLNMQSKTAGPNYARANINPAMYRKGEIELDGEKHQIALIDFNSNGRFDDEYAIDPNIRMSNDRVYPKTGDKIFIDPDANDKYMGYYLADRADTFPVAKLIAVGGKYYNLSVSPSGDKISLTPSDIKLGAAKNPGKKYYAVFYGDKGTIKVNGEADKEVMMPEGDWQLMEYTIDATEGNSNRGQSNQTRVAAMGTKKSPVFKVRSGQTVDLPFGPPYKPLVLLQRTSRQAENKTVYLELLLQGSGEGVCRDLRVNGRTPDQPSFVIATKNNEIVERGAFEYG